MEGVQHKYYESCVHFTNKVIKTLLHFTLNSEKNVFGSMKHFIMEYLLAKGFITMDKDDNDDGDINCNDKFAMCIFTAFATRKFHQRS